MAVDALLGRGHLEDRVDVEFLLLVDQAIDFHFPRAGAEILGQLGRLVFFGGELVVVVVVGNVFVGRDRFGRAQGTLLDAVDLVPSERGGRRAKTISRTPTPVPPQHLPAPRPARNLRRFRYRLLGVISDERMSSAFLISMRTPVLYTRIRDRRI